MNDKDEAIREEILNEAQKLFRHYGWCKTTMEDIAKAAGKGKSTLYYYYKSKDEIFGEVVSLEMDEVFSTIQKEVENEQTAEAKLKAFWVTRFKILQKKAVLCKVVRREVEANLPRLIELNRRYDKREISLMRNILKFGLDKGEFTHYAAGDVDAFAFSMVCAFRGVEIGLVIEDRFSDLESKIDVLIDLMMRGLKA